MFGSVSRAFPLCFDRWNGADTCDGSPLSYRMGECYLRIVVTEDCADTTDCTQHLESGLAVVFIEAPVEAQSTVILPQQMKDQCASLGIPSTGVCHSSLSFSSHTDLPTCDQNIVGQNTTSTAGFPRSLYGPSIQIPGFHARGAGALAGTILAALLGMAAVVWYAMGGQLDEDEVREEVEREMALKRAEKERKAAGWRGAGGRAWRSWRGKTE